jgi:hypothetical protein
LAGTVEQERRDADTAGEVGAATKRGICGETGGSATGVVRKSGREAAPWEQALSEHVDLLVEASGVAPFPGHFAMRQSPVPQQQAGSETV